MKKIIAFLLAITVVFSLSAWTVLAASYNVSVQLDSGEALDEDGDSIDGDYGIEISDGQVTADEIPSGTKFYVRVNGADFERGTPASSDELCDTHDFSFKLDRDENSSLLESVKLVRKSLGGSTRANYIEVKLKESTKLDEKKLSFDVYFKAKRTVTGKWNSGDTAGVRFVLWVGNRVEDGNDVTIPTGEGVVFNPVSNETNTITWGDDADVASLEFKATQDADKFYAKLSTKVNRTIYEDYGDPMDADLFFRTFAGSPAIDTTSRATLTLYNPWENDDYYDRYYYNHRYYDNVNPRDAHIYQIDRDGYLVDVTDQFQYVRGGETLSGIDGWQTRVRTLGAYVISDIDLGVDDVYDDPNVDPLPPLDTPDAPVTPATPAVPVIPQRPTPAPAPTGSSDFLTAAIAIAMLSLCVIVLSRETKK